MHRHKSKSYEGGWGIFEPYEFFSLICRVRISSIGRFKFRVTWRTGIFSFNFPLHEYIFCTPPISFLNVTK